MIKVTKDSSQTIFSAQFNEHYHSTHGAYTEAMHVFIEHGLKLFKDSSQVSIFEMGFGTGLNAYLTYKEKAAKQEIRYDSIELYPLTDKIYKQLNYAKEETDFFIENFHNSPWNEDNTINQRFMLHKINADIKTYNFEHLYDLIYFDAFSPSHQEECWSEDLFIKFFDAMKDGGFLVTYCAKGNIKRLLKKIGFNVQTLEGPPGKREMVRAVK